MEILRIAENSSSDGIEVSITIPGSHEESECQIMITDLGDSSILSVAEDLAGGSEYTFYLSKKYDNSYKVEVVLDSSVIFEEYYTVVRPYVNPHSAGTTASEIAEYLKHEELARAIIDTHITDGFYNKKKAIQAVGQGGDYFSLWEPVHQILRVYENNVLVYDIDTPEENVLTYSVTADGSAIQRSETELFNRLEHGAQQYPASYGDLGYVGSSRSVDFPRGYDYVFIVDTGYKVLPSDVVRAASLLIDDIKCGKLDYYAKYVTSYNTDQYKVQFDKRMLEGTGNALVDKILDKYLKNITRPGLL